MAQVVIMFTAQALVNSLIVIPDGIELQQIESATIQDVSAHAAGPRTPEAKGDGNPSLGLNVKLQADGKSLRSGHLIGDGDIMILNGPLSGEVQGYGDGT